MYIQKMTFKTELRSNVFI